MLLGMGEVTRHRICLRLFSDGSGVNDLTTVPRAAENRVRTLCPLMSLVEAEPETVL